MTLVVQEPHAQLPMHRHEDARVIVILSGCVREVDLEGQYAYNAGEIIFRPPYYIHANAGVSERTRYLRLTVSRKTWADFVAMQGWRSARGRTALNEAEALDLAREPFGGDVLLGLFNSEPEKRYDGDSAVHRLARQLREETGQAVRLDHCAEELGLRPYELTRLFRKERGLSPRSYRMESRLQYALRSLSYGWASLAEIAAECGFSDQSHFTRAIVAATGKTPSALRRAFAG